MSTENQPPVDGQLENNVGEATPAVESVEPKPAKVPFQLKRRAMHPLTPAFKKRYPMAIGAAGYPAESDRIDPKYWSPIDPDDARAAMPWWVAVDDAYKSALFGDIYQTELDKAPQSWRQVVTHRGKDLVIAPRDYGVSKLSGNVELTGKKFTAAIRRSKGDSSEIIVPLWHTGIWVSIKPAKDLRWLSFDAERIERRISIGRDTNGLILSTRAVYEQEDILNFTVEHITQANVSGFQPDELLKIIKGPDIPILSWACAVANYVDGYPYSIPCLHDPSKCMEVAEVRLDLKALSWVNPDKLTPAQIEHMYHQEKAYTLDEIKTYQEAGIFALDRRIVVDDAVTLTVQIPDAESYLAGGRIWTESIVDAIDNGLKNASESNSGRNISDRSRMIQLMRGVTRTQLREFSPWIKRVDIKLDDDTTVWSEAEGDIFNFLEENSNDPELVEKIHKVVKEYINEVTMNIIGYPSYRCPACDNGIDVNDADFHKAEVETIVAMDPIKAFFWLMDLRLEPTRQQVPSNMAL